MGRPNNVTDSVGPGKDTTVCDNLIGHPAPVRLEYLFNGCDRRKASPQAGCAFSYGTWRPDLANVRNLTRIHNATINRQTANSSALLEYLSLRESPGRVDLDIVQFPGFPNVRCSRRLRVTTLVTALTWHGSC